MIPIFFFIGEYSRASKFLREFLDEYSNFTPSQTAVVPLNMDRLGPYRQQLFALAEQLATKDIDVVELASSPRSPVRSQQYTLPLISCPSLGRALYVHEVGALQFEVTFTGDVV